LSPIRANPTPPASEAPATAIFSFIIPAAPS
jgi:hypothetical protein